MVQPNQRNPLIIAVMWWKLHRFVFSFESSTPSCQKPPGKLHRNQMFYLQEDIYKESNGQKLLNGDKTEGVISLLKCVALQPWQISGQSKSAYLSGGYCVLFPGVWTPAVCDKYSRVWSDRQLYGWDSTMALDGAYWALNSKTLTKYSSGTLVHWGPNGSVCTPPTKFLKYFYVP